MYLVSAALQLKHARFEERDNELSHNRKCCNKKAPHEGFKRG